MLRPPIFSFFFFNDTATTEIYTLSLHDALPIYRFHKIILRSGDNSGESPHDLLNKRNPKPECRKTLSRSEEHTSELQSLAYLVCRLLLEKKKKKNIKLIIKETLRYTHLQI